MVTLQLGLLTSIIASSPGAQLLLFETPNCPHCQAMHATVQRLRAAGLPVQSIDVERFPDLARQYQVRRIPSFVMIRNGRETARIVGRCSFAKLRQLMQTHSVSGRNNPIRFQSPPTTTQPVDSTTGPLTVALHDEVDVTGNRQDLVAGSSSGNRAHSEENSNPPTAQALRATVKIEVSNSRDSLLGTGTIIDSREGEALIITCGHLFRDAAAQAEILVTLYDGRNPEVLPATLLEFDADRIDVGFLVVHPRRPVTSVSVAQQGFRLSVQQSVFSIACASGELPKVSHSQVSALNRYLGPANIEITGEPVDGASGGGLFDSRGRLTGICRAADPNGKKGVYVGLPVLHQQLTAIGQSHLTQSSQPSPTGFIGSIPGERLAAARAIEVNGDVATPRQSTGGEIFCIIRQPGQQTDGELMVIKNPSPELLVMLEREARRSTSKDSVQPARSAHQPSKSSPYGNVAAEIPSHQTTKDPFQPHQSPQQTTAPR